MVLIVGEALIDLSLGEVRETSCRQRVNCFAILEQSDNVVHAEIRVPYTLALPFRTPGERTM